MLVLASHVVCVRWLITTLALKLPSLEIGGGGIRTHGNARAEYLLHSASLQDALCEVPSDWLDQGQSEMYVPTVPDGFMREVVIHEQAYKHSTASTRFSTKRPSRSIFYHFFHMYDTPGGGPSVERKALLQAAVNPDDADADDTVEAFLRSSLYTQMGQSLQLSDFDFHDAENCCPCAVNAPAPASRSLPPLSPAKPPTPSPAEDKPVKSSRPRDKIFQGGALQCCGCGRWHNVPEEVMRKVIAAHPVRLSAVCKAVVVATLLLTECGGRAGSEEGRWHQVHMCTVEGMARRL